MCEIRRLSPGDVFSAVKTRKMHLHFVTVSFVVEVSLGILWQVVAGSDAPVAEVAQGTLVGKYGTTREGREYEAFMGIPYALPPVGDLRFKVRNQYIFQFWSTLGFNGCIFLEKLKHHK